MRVPRVKPEHRATRTSNSGVRIGAQVYGIAAEISDPDGTVWTLLKMMDGSRTADQVVDEVIANHPQRSHTEIIQGMQQLISAGYIEDASSSMPPGLSEREQDRYNRSRQYFRTIDLHEQKDPWQFQRTIKKARVAVLGVGGVGNVVAAALAQAGVGHITLVDFDRVELSNLNRQILFTEEDIGKLKADVAVNRLRGINSDVEVVGVNQCIASSEDISHLTQDTTMVAMCADKPVEIRDWANMAFIQAQRPWSEGGYHGPQIRISMYTPGFGGCFACNRAFENARQRQFTCQDLQLLNEDEIHTTPVFPSNTYLAGSLMANAVLAGITGVPRFPRSYTVGFNLVDIEHPYEFITYPKWPECTVCTV